MVGPKLCVQFFLLKVFLLLFILDCSLLLIFSFLSSSCFVFILYLKKIFFFIFPPYRSFSFYFHILQHVFFDFSICFLLSALLSGFKWPPSCEILPKGLRRWINSGSLVDQKSVPAILTKTLDCHSVSFWSKLHKLWSYFPKHCPFHFWEWSCPI